MTGIDWLMEQERLSVGFLERAYRLASAIEDGEPTRFSRRGDELCAALLEGMASLQQVRLTGRIVEAARHELGMKSRKGPACESGYPTCGPVAVRTEQGVPLCQGCADAVATAGHPELRPETIPEAWHETMASDRAPLPPCDHGFRWPSTCRECEAAALLGESQREWLTAESTEQETGNEQLPLALVPEPSLADLVQAEVARQLAPLQSLFPLLGAIRAALDGGVQ